MSKTESSMSSADFAKLEKMRGQKEGETASVQGAPASTQLETSVPDTLIRKSTSKGDGLKTKSPLDSIGAISIRPYAEGRIENMGLENYGYVVFPGTFQEEQLAALERFGKVRYITGLDEYAPEVQNIKDASTKNAVIKNIRFIVSELEKSIATNQVDPEDPEFWNKVTTLRPDNIPFWSQITLRCGNEPIYLDPKKDPFDLIKLMAIEAGGFDIVAKSFEDARSKSSPPKFYLDKEVDTVSTRTEYKKLRNRAIGLLDDLYTKNPKKLLYVTKIVDAYSAKYKSSTPLDVLYEQMDEYIAGNGAEKNKNRASEQFITAAELDMATLKLRAMVKDATFYKFIIPKPDGMLYHMTTSTMLGRNVADVVEYFKSPLNEDMLVRLMSEVEEYWK